MIIKNKSHAPEFEGLVKISMVDAVTGKVLNSEQFAAYQDLYHCDSFEENTATFDACRGHAHNCIPDDNQFKMTRIEWGWGNSTTSRGNTDLSGAFSPAVYTPITSYDFPTPDHKVLRLTSLLTNELLTFPTPDNGGPISPPYPYVREMCIRSNPTDGFPKGLMYARFVADADIPKPTSLINIRLEWLYVFI